MHADLEQLLLDQGSDQRSLYGFNIIFDPWEIEYDSLINAPRNRDAGYPRDGRGVSDPVARKKDRESGTKMGKLMNDSEVMKEWFAMPIELQISNIGSEVLRADRWKKRGNEKNMRSFYNAAIDFLKLSIRDPKNKGRIGELNLCIDELADYFIGENRWGTTSDVLKKYYDAFL